MLRELMRFRPSNLRRAVLLADEMVTEMHLDMTKVSGLSQGHTQEIEGMPWEGSSLKEIIRSNTLGIEREVIVQALKYTGGNKAKAARLLQIDYKTIHTKVKQLGISI